VTTKQIEASRVKANIKFELAKQIRDLLDAARKDFGAQDWDDNDMENEILELVTSEE
jgi:hypothetical protein